MLVHEKIRQRRKELGLSQEQLALEIGYKSRSIVNKIEKGLSNIPLNKIKLFANALSTTSSWLLEDETSPPDEPSEIHSILTKDDYLFADREILRIMKGESEMQASYGGADLAFNSTEEQQRFEDTLKQVILNTIIQEREGLLKHISQKKL